MATILGDPEALIAEVDRSAHHKAVEIAEDARRRAAAILEGANEESNALRRESGLEAQRKAEALARKYAALAELEAQRRFIQLREAPIDRVWRGAQDRLRDLVRQPAYLDVLKRLALEAAMELGAGEIVLAADPIGHPLLSEGILKAWSSEAGAQFRRAPEPAACRGGLLATSGRSRLDLTFTARLAEAKLALRERVFDALTKERA
jgi:vacuolar-type H+-ATPase subunit E/Vma4